MTSTDIQGDRRLLEIDDLPRVIEPGRDLWPAISAGLPGRQPKADAQRITVRRGWGLGAVAASIAVAFLAGLLFGRQASPPVPAGPGLSLADAAAPSVIAAMQAVEVEYASAYKGFRPLMLQPSLFEARTTEELRASWAVMQEAELALKAALDEYPDNPFLGAKLLDLRAQQLEFMRQLHMLDQNSWRKT